MKSPYLGKRFVRLYTSLTHFCPHLNWGIHGYPIICILLDEHFVLATVHMTECQSVYFWSVRLWI